LLVAIRGFGGLFSVFLSGAAADFLGEKKVLGIVIAGQAVSAFAIPHLEGFAALAVGFFLLGFFINGAQPVFSSLIVRSMPVREWTQVYAAEYWALNVGFAITAIGGGWVAAWDYAWLFYLEAILTAVALGLVIWKLPQTGGSRRRRADIPPSPCGIVRRAVRVLDRVLVAAQDKLAVALISATFLFTLCLSQMTAMLPLDMEQAGFSPDQYGYVIFWNGAMLGLFQILTGKVLANRPQMRVLVAAALVSAVGYSLLAVTANQLWFVFGCVTIWTLGEMLDAPVRNAVVSSLAKPGSRGRYMGLLSAALTAGYCFGPLFGGWVLEQFGRSVLWISVGLLSVLAAGIRYAVSTRIKRRLAADGGDA
ncbi:MAG: MFS transporter, partial [Propionibacteriaceae bacterium]|jgi:predicted MFS family arabinose efflux permease|nr:MFS transporter [Propionibacteriaceae bacterium]